VIEAQNRDLFIENSLPHSRASYIKEAPDYAHFSFGFVVLTFAYMVLNHEHSLNLVGSSVWEILNRMEVPATLSYSGIIPIISIVLKSGEPHRIVVNWQYSGMISIMFFGFIMLTTMFLLRGPLWFKSLVLTLGIFIGFVWNISKLALISSVLYFYDPYFFKFFNYVLAPFTDFIWMITIWSLGMGHLGNLSREG